MVGTSPKRLPHRAPQPRDGNATRCTACVPAHGTDSRSATCVPTSRAMAH